MELLTALALISTRLAEGGFEVVGGELPLGPSAILKDDEGTQVFIHLWQEPNDDWSVVTQVTSNPLTKHLRLSIKFEKLLNKASKAARKKNLGLYLEDGRLVGKAAFSRELVSVADLRLQERQILLEIENLVNAGTSKLKLNFGYESN